MKFCEKNSFGNKSIKNDQIIPELSLRSRNVYQKKDVQEAANTIRSLYKRSGYFSAKIKPSISPSKSTRDSISSFNKIISKKPASNTDLLNEEGVVNSPLPGTASLKCKVGDKVKKGDLLVILESMKMENPKVSPNGRSDQTG